MSIDLIRTRIKHKMRIKEDAAFDALDFQKKGFLELSDFRRMFQVHGLVPAERNLGLMFTSFNRSDTDSLGFEDFIQAMQPFLAAQKQVDFA